MSKNKKRILVFAPARNGVILHRLINPYSKLGKKYDVKVLDQVPTIEELVNVAKGFDIFVFSRTMPDGFIEALREIPTLKIICDNDDWWVLPQEHPLYLNYKMNNVPDRIIKHMKLADYCTTTNECLRRKILDFNPNCYVLPNGLTLDCAGGWSLEKTKSTKIRFGFVLSSSHTKDMELIEGIWNQLPQDVKDKVQFRLCGFDSGKTTVWRQDGKHFTVDTPWDEVCWTKWEKELTDNYKSCSPEYTAFLKKFEKVDYEPEDEHYVRCWTKDIFHYGEFYKDIDVLMVPLVKSEFNSCKSTLKLAEAGMTHTAVICSLNVPYTEYLDFHNSVWVRQVQKTKGFVEAITKIVRQPMYVEKLGDCLNEMYKSKWDLDVINEKRIEVLEELLYEYER